MKATDSFGEFDKFFLDLQGGGGGNIGDSKIVYVLDISWKLKHFWAKC